MVSLPGHSIDMEIDTMRRSKLYCPECGKKVAVRLEFIAGNRYIVCRACDYDLTEDYNEHTAELRSKRPSSPAEREDSMTKLKEAHKDDPEEIWESDEEDEEEDW